MQAAQQQLHVLVVVRGGDSLVVRLGEREREDATGVRDEDEGGEGAERIDRHRRQLSANLT